MVPNERAARRPILGLRQKSAPVAMDVEYRVVWNAASQVWNVFRNGAPTNVSERKKKTSAIASALRDAKAEREASGATIAVLCVEGRKIETVWKGQ
jgi:hypothetical protein